MKRRPFYIDNTLIVIGVVYGIVAFVAAYTIHFQGDEWWPATLLLFGPRWILLLPLGVLLPCAFLCEHRLLLTLIASFGIIFGPVMGYTVPFKKWMSQTSQNNQRLRIITCNLQNGEYNRAIFNAFISNSRPDLVVLQELPARQKISELEGWHHLLEGDLHIFSRFPLQRGVSKQLMVPLHTWPRSCLLSCTVTTPHGDVSLATVHLPSPRYGLQNILDRNTLINLGRINLLLEETVYRRKISSEVAQLVASLPSPKIIAGDFNMPVESTIYKDFWDEFRNAFTERGYGFGWTERGTVRGVPVAMRIDHVLVDKSGVPVFCEIGSDVGSDHLPIIAEIGY